MGATMLAATTDANLCYITAEQAVAAFKARQLSPVELMRAVIPRCESVNPKVNALTHMYFDWALEEAKEAERRYARGGGNPRPLEGIPLAIKDLHPVKGEITTWGSKIFEGVRADYTLPIVQRLLDAGAILHIRTTTPEFAHTGHCHSPLWGATRNPWNTEYSSGGSSGGSAVAVATGMTTLADGDDGGGSIRIPSSANGVFGFKPPFGRNPGCLLPTNHDWILHLGPITRSVGDAIIMQNIMSGSHPDDIVSLKPKIDVPLKGGSMKGKKVAFSMDLGYFPVDSEVRQNTLAAVDVFKSLGGDVVEGRCRLESGSLRRLDDSLGRAVRLCGRPPPSSMEVRDGSLCKGTARARHQPQLCQGQANGVRAGRDVQEAQSDPSRARVSAVSPDRRAVGCGMA